MQGAELFHEQGCDAIVAVGGGSPMDCAKGIGIVSSSGRHILEFEGVDRIKDPMPPLICIPTTAGTAADVSQFAVILNTPEKLKIVIAGKAAVPDVALIDPLPLTSMPAYLTACTGLDALVHAIEAYVSSASSPVTDLQALEAIRLISANLLKTIQEPDDITLRGRMMLGSLAAGMAFSNASLGAVHAMAHSLGGLLDLPHGECNAILLDHVMAYNFTAAGERYRRVGEALGLDLRGLSDCAPAVLDAIRSLKTAVGVTRRLGELGVQTGDLNALAAKAINDICIVTNPRKPSRGDLEAIYAEAL
jgi:alcohol dehydrogenase class IV